MGNDQTAAILQVLEQQAAAETLASTKLTGAQYDHAKKTLTRHTDDAALNERNAKTWHAFQQEFRAPERRAFKYQHEMTVGEFAQDALDDGRSVGGGFVIDNADIGTLTQLAGDPLSPEYGFLAAQIKRAQQEGRIIPDPAHRWPGESDDQRAARLNQLIDSMNVAFLAAQHATETTATITKMQEGGTEAPEVRSYLNRRVTEMEKTAAREQWGDQTVSPLQLPEVISLQRTAAAIDAAGE